ncbi:MAG: tetratricopeptide repeat protein [Spirochaetes bacterium]|nr:tetratricopeptide repeat protein [Spirochaetota bacterium]
MRRTEMLTLCLIGLAVGLGISEGKAQPLDLNPVETLLKEGKGKEALFIIDSFLEHFPTESDLLYMKGLALPHEVLSLQKALQYNSWKKYKDSNARLLLVERLLRRKQFLEAQSVLQGITTGETLPEYWYFLAQIQFGKGNKEEGDQTLRKAISIFPKDPRFLTLYFRNKAHATPTDSSLWELIDSKNPYFLEAMAEYLCILPEGDRRNTLLQEYFRLGGKDPRVILPRVGVKDDEFEAQWDRVRELGGFSSIELWEQAFSRFPTGKIRERLEQDLRKYSGQMNRDADRDGYMEEVRRFVEGNLTYLALDSNQDGEWDLQIDFVVQKPYRIQIHRGGMETIQVFFIDYPRIDRILVQQEKLLREYRYGNPPFIWKESLFPPTEKILPFVIAPVRMDALDRFLLFSFREANPYQRIDTCTRCKRVRKFLYQDGTILSFQEEQEIRTGEIRKRTVSFREGMPVVGFIDVDGDGVSEIRELYRNGALESIELVSGTRTSYREFLSNQLKEWDFNGDGKIDAREYTVGRGRKMVEFSSLLDTIFDARAWLEEQ